MATFFFFWISNCLLGMPSGGNAHLFDGTSMKIDQTTIKFTFTATLAFLGWDTS